MKKGPPRANMDPLLGTEGGLGLVRADGRTPGLYYGFAFYSGPANSHGLNYGYGQNGVCGAFP